MPGVKKNGVGDILQKSERQQDLCNQELWIHESLSLVLHTSSESWVELLASPSLAQVLRPHQQDEGRHSYTSVIQ